MSAPEDGAANEELVKFLAKQLGIAKSNIQVAKGMSSRKKLIEIICCEGLEKSLNRLIGNSDL